MVRGGGQGPTFTESQGLATQEGLVASQKTVGIVNEAACEWNVTRLVISPPLLIAQK